MSDDFTSEITRALADLESQAPPPPSLDDIRAGGPVPLVAKPEPAWRRPAVLVGAAAAVTVLVVGFAALIASGVGGSGEPISDTLPPTEPVVTDASADVLPVGIWVVDSYTHLGETVTVDRAAIEASGSQVPYVSITQDLVEGWSGCNAFGSSEPPVLERGRLVFGEVFANAAGCLDETSVTESALLAALWSDGVDVTVDDTTMTWSNDAVQVTFVQSERIPSQAPPTWSTSEGRLDCAPDSVMSFDIPGRDVDPAIIFELFPDVVAVEGDAILGSSDPFAWGLDASGRVVAGAAPHDLEPPMYEVFTCSATVGMRPGADLTGAATTWINDLGLGQTSRPTWNSRFIEVCSSSPEDLPFLAATYVQADAELSLAPDGAVPTTDQATQTLTVIRAMVCAEDGEVSTTTVPTPATTIPGGEACSSLGADGPAIDASFQGLPEPVLQARALLLRLAIACDLEGIVGYAANSAGGAALADEIFFWGNADSEELLRAYDAETGALLLLVEALTRVPYEEILMSEYDPEEVVPDAVFYSWPPQADLTGGRSLADLWDEPTLIAVAALNGASVEELVELSDEIGGYAGFRVGIRDDGRWLFALAGD